MSLKREWVVSYITAMRDPILRETLARGTIDDVTFSQLFAIDVEDARMVQALFQDALLGQEKLKTKGGESLNSERALRLANSIRVQKRYYPDYVVELIKRGNEVVSRVYFYKESETLGGGASGGVYIAEEMFKDVFTGKRYLIKVSSIQVGRRDLQNRARVVDRRIASLKREYETNVRLEQRMGRQFVEQFAIPVVDFFRFFDRGVLVFEKVVGRSLNEDIDFRLGDKMGRLYLDLRNADTGLTFEQVIAFVNDVTQNGTLTKPKLVWLATYVQQITKSFMIGFQLLKMCTLLTRRGIYHFDIKPANIIVDFDETRYDLNTLARDFANNVTSAPQNVKLIDFAGTCLSYMEANDANFTSTCVDNYALMVTRAYADPLALQKAVSKDFYTANAEFLRVNYGIRNFPQWVKFRNERLDVYSLAKVIMLLFSTLQDPNMNSPTQITTIHESFMAPPALIQLLTDMTGDVPRNPTTQSAFLDIKGDEVTERTLKFLERPSMEESLQRFVEIAIEFYGGPFSQFMLLIPRLKMNEN